LIKRSVTYRILMWLKYYKVQETPGPVLT